MNKLQKFLAQEKKTLSNNDFTLLTNATNCLMHNIISGEDCSWKSRLILIPSKTSYLGAWNWDSAFHTMALMFWDEELAYEQVKIFLDYQDEKGMFPDAILADGRVFDTITKPPIIPYALELLHKHKQDLFDVNFVYDKLVKNVQFFENYRRVNDLFHYDSFLEDDYYFTDCKNESGWDNSVRWDDGASNKYAIDLNCYMVLFYRSLSYFANQINLDSSIWDKKEKDLSNAINDKLFNKESCCYFDYNYKKNEFSKVYSPASFMPLYIKIAPKDYAEKMIHILKDKFLPLIPTVSYDDKNYSSSDYWRGPTWINMAYFVAVGAKNYGYNEEYDIIRENILNVCYNEKDGIYEYYDSKSGKGLGAYQFGWSSVFIIKFILKCLD